MAIIFLDHFTVGSDTALTAHTPDTGTSWTEIVNVLAVVMNAITSTNTAGATASTTNGGQLLQANPAPSGAEYDVEATLSAVDTGTSSRRLRLHARMLDADNYYSFEMLPTGHASNDATLYKVVATVKTSLATVDTGLTVGDVYKLQIRNNSQKVYKNGVQILSATDAALTSTGAAGLSIGKITASDIGNTGLVWRVDDFTVTEVAAAADDVATKFLQIGSNPLLMISGG